MEYRYNLEALNRLADIKTAKDIKQLSYAQFPGTHCPLFGVALCSIYIKNMITLVVGTDECNYYTKTMQLERMHADEDLENTMLSFALTHDDVVFGCREKLERAVRDIDETYRPDAILIVTTCVPEIIGEDLEAMTVSLQDTTDARILVVHTEHFKCNSHIPGIERALAALANLMEPQSVRKNTVNVLGHRYEGINATELFQILSSKGVSIHQVLPSRCEVRELRIAPAASLNIVTDFTALPLAELMKERFGTDYVYFDKYLNLERIKAGYEDIARKLNLELTDEISQMYAKASDHRDMCRRLLDGKTFVYGNTPMLAFEVTSFLCDIGMKPLLVQARDLYADDHRYMQEILCHGVNPYVSRVANIAPMSQVYRELKPDIYIGHESPERLARFGITQVVLDAAAKKLGFQVPNTVLSMMVRSIEGFAGAAQGKGEPRAAV